jgi:hypothetical protein
MTLSSLVHWIIWGDAGLSVCGRAWLQREHYPLWRWTVRLAGEDHCRRSYEYHAARARS